MRLVDEIPTARAAGRYPYDEISRLIDEGSIVALDADEYQVANANSIKTNVMRWGKRHNKSWRVTVRGRTAYVSPGADHYGPTGALGR